MGQSEVMVQKLLLDLASGTSFKFSGLFFLLSWTVFVGP